MWQEYYAYTFNKVLTAGSGTAFESMIKTFDSDADFVLHSITFNATSPAIMLKLRDTFLDKFFEKGGGSDKSVDLRTIAGRYYGSHGLSPLILPIPYVIPAGTNFIIDAADNSSASNTFYITFHGAKIRQGKQPWNDNWDKSVFFYTARNQSIAANTTVYLTIDIDIDSHFLLTKLTSIRTENAMNVRLNIADSSTDRNWYSEDTPAENVLGSAEFPFILPANRFLRKGSSVIATITNNDSSSQGLDITLSGLKLYE